MRAGACTVQQALTPDAAAVVKQAVSLARRRGNPQVTPLHVASAMLQQQGSSGLLRAACLRSHSHPLQCKALELCFNVALNRLPAASTSPLLVGHGHMYYPPSLSNALVAAFKRAQAHQRRGSAADTQQQPVLAVKIELEQLVVSILDDPSVSRVMREAGFSSTQVKANVEHAVSSSVEGNSSPASTSGGAPAAAPPESPSATPAEETKPSNKLLLLPLDRQARDEDVRAVLECMASRSKRRLMVVAECAATAEAAARAAVDKIRRGEALRGAQVVSLRVSRFRDMPRDDAERLLAELRRAVKSAVGGRAAGGLVIFVEDLAWAAAEFSAAGGRGRWPSTTSYCYYSAVEHAVAEVRSLACHDGGDGVWLVGHGTYQSYMRCRAGRPSLEMLWELQTLAVPTGSLALSLNLVDDDGAIVVNHPSIRAKCDGTSGNGSSSRCLSLLEPGSSGQLTTASTFCGECSATKRDAVKPLPRSVLSSSSSGIPHWLQHCRSDQEVSHSKRWSSMYGGSASRRTTTLNLSTVVSPSSSVSSYEKNYHLHQPYHPWLLADDVDEAKDHQAWKCRGRQIHVVDEDVKLVRAIKVKSRDSSSSNGSVAEEVQCRRSRFKELSAENLRFLCSVLEKEVPWQADLVPEIASTVLRCRSGMAPKRRRNVADASSMPANGKEDTWMFFLGGDAEGKARVARELAGLVFGSRKCFVSIGAAASSSPAKRSDSTEQQGSKRPASNDDGGCLDRLYEAVRDNPHRVIMVEDVERSDRRCQTGIMEAVETGFVRCRGGGEAALGDAIVILSCESFDARSRASSPPATKKAKLESEQAKTKEDDGAGDHHHKEPVAAGATSASSFDLNMSLENDDVEDSCFFTDAGLLNAVDRAFFFRRQDETSD